jgi:signal transduction histidine kinase
MTALSATVPRGPDMLLVAVAAALLVAAVVFLTLWLRARWALRRLREDRGEAEWDRLDRELELAEQASRFRIVGELGDVAVAAVSRLASGAEGIGYAVRTDAEAAVRSAAALQTAARDALADLRRIQTVVHEGERATQPQPSLHSARDLFRAMQDAGLAVTFTESGERFGLRPGAELAVFRILQTSLENALTHGGAGTAVAVAFTWTAEGLQITVDDDGIRAAARRAGHDAEGVDQATQYSIDDDLRALTESYDGAGLSELRERAALFGGTLNARTVPGVGFSVSVVFPALRFHNGVHGVDLGR